MQNQTQERYVSLRMAHGDMEQVIQITHRAKIDSEEFIKYHLAQIAIITYARPFGKVNGEFRNHFRPIVASDIAALDKISHNLLISERDERIAHGDIKVRKPKLSHWPSVDLFPISFKSSQLYNDKDALLRIIESLASVVLEWLLGEMKSMEQNFRKESLTQVMPSHEPTDKS